MNQNQYEHSRPRIDINVPRKNEPNPTPDWPDTKTMNRMQTKFQT